MQLRVKNYWTRKLAICLGLLYLSGCYFPVVYDQDSEKAPVHPDFSLSIVAIERGVLQVQIKPKTPTLRQVYFLSWHSPYITLNPDKTPTKEEKDATIALVFQETKEKELALIYLKQGVQGDNTQNPFFGLYPVKDKKGNFIGGEAQGVQARMMFTNMGKGVKKTPLGKTIAWDPEKGYEFLIKMKLETTRWQTLGGILRMSLLRPGFLYYKIIPNYSVLG